MPLVACPTCKTTLKIPDGSVGNVKCPKCGVIFAIATKPAPPPAFEVVDNAPKPGPRPAPAPPPVPPRPAPPPGNDFDFEVVDEPRRKRRRDDDDDDYDDRPRGRRRDDDDDDYDDRPRRRASSRRRRDDDDDDYDDRRPGGGKAAAMGNAKIGLLFVSISLWLYLGTFALMALFLLLAWVGASIPNGLVIVTGLLGLANWVTALIGLGFCVAGPPRARGLAIAATAVAAVHLVMAFVVANNKDSASFGFHTAAMLSSMNKFEQLTDLMKKIEKETDPKRRESLQDELRSLSESGRDARPDRGSGGDMRWQDLATLQPHSDQLIGVLAYQSKIFGDYVLGLLTGLLEVARLVLLVLVAGAVARAARDHDTANQSTLAAVLAGGAAVVAMIVVVLVMVILDNSKPTTPKSLEDAQKAAKGILTWAVLGELLVYALHIGSLVLPAVLVSRAKAAAARRARRGD